jgi:TetR/AcrR family transcriptional regulator, transcriptional repressor of bet genes
MEYPMAQASKTKERRDQIAQALQQVMARKGYEGASIQEIASVAGLAPGLVHYHYKSKQEILLALLENLAERQARRLEEHLAGVSGFAILDGFIDAHLALGRSADPEALACWIAFSAEAIRQEEVRKAFAGVVSRFVKQLEGLLQEGSQSGAFPCADPESVACAIYAAIQGYYSLAATARSLIPKGSAAPAVRKMARSLLATREVVEGKPHELWGRGSGGWRYLLGWLSEADFIIHETNLGPAHTPLAALAKLPEAIRKKIGLVHYQDGLDVVPTPMKFLVEGSVIQI